MTAPLCDKKQQQQTMYRVLVLSTTVFTAKVIAVRRTTAHRNDPRLLGSILRSVSFLLDTREPVTNYYTVNRFWNIPGYRRAADSVEGRCYCRNTLADDTW